MWSKALKGREGELRERRQEAVLRRRMLPYLRKGYTHAEALLLLGAEVAAGEGEAKAPATRKPRAKRRSGAAPLLGGVLLLVASILLGGILSMGCGYRWRMELFEETRGIRMEAEGRTDDEASTTRNVLLYRVSVSASASERGVHATQADEEKREDVRGDDAKTETVARVTRAY